MTDRETRKVVSTCLFGGPLGTRHRSSERDFYRRYLPAWVRAFYGVFPGWELRIHVDDCHGLPPAAVDRAEARANALQKPAQGRTHRGAQQKLPSDPLVDPCDGRRNRSEGLYGGTVLVGMLGRDLLAQSGDLPTQRAHAPLDCTTIWSVHAHERQVAEGGIAEGRATLQLGLGKACVVVTCGVRDRRVPNRIGLNDHTAGALTSPSAARDLRQQLEGPFGRAGVR